MTKFLTVSFLFIAVILTSCVTRQKIYDGQMHILSPGYTGRVTIIFRQKDGAEIKKADGMTVFEVPETGILKTKSKFTPGLIYCDKLQFLYINNRDSAFIPELGLTAKDKMDPKKIYMYDWRGNGDTLKYTIGYPLNTANH